MKGYTYILKCCDNSYYTGSTNNIEARLYQHQTGQGANYTQKRLPVELVYMEEYERIDEAYYREKQLQGWSRKKKEALINGEYDKLPLLSASTSSASESVREPFAPLRQAQRPRASESYSFPELAEGIIDDKKR